MTDRLKIQKHLMSCASNQKEILDAQAAIAALTRERSDDRSKV